MFNQEFFPTPSHVIELMCEGLTLRDRVILEPSAGKGDIVKFLTLAGAEVLACEINKDLQEILKTKCTLIGEDFLKVTSDKVSHIDGIIMNPPFSNADKHILHAYSIAPAGCKIVALCNAETLKNTAYSTRRELKTLVETFGQWHSIGNVFEEAERATSVEVAFITLNKPGAKESSEFEGFFTEEEPEQQQFNGLMPYNFVRDIVNRYIGAVKIFDEQLESAVKMNYLTRSFYSSSLAVSITEDNKPIKRNEFKKDLQKNAWNFVFSKMNMGKFMTRGLNEDINKFVEQQQHIPFTMKNIYRMLEIVIGTQGQRMDKALLEVFDKVTDHHHDNRMNLEGWKTNSHFLVNKRFIFPYGAKSNYSGGIKIPHYGYAGEILTDFEKALCFITGESYDTIRGIYHLSDKLTPGLWYDTHFFRLKGFKKGTVHIEFRDTDVWGKFNQNVARIKGYPLFEAKPQTAYQDRQTGRKQQAKGPMQKPVEKAKVLFEVKI